MFQLPVILRVRPDSRATQVPSGLRPDRDGPRDQCGTSRRTSHRGCPFIARVSLASGKPARLPRSGRRPKTRCDDRRLALTKRRDHCRDAGRDGTATRSREALPARRADPKRRSIAERTYAGLITYASEPGSRVPGYLLIPKETYQRNLKRIQAVLCLHGTDNVVGHGTVVGLGNTAEPSLRGGTGRTRLRHPGAELSAAGQVSTRPEEGEARLEERDAKGRLGQQTRPGPAGVARRSWTARRKWVRWVTRWADTTRSTPPCYDRLKVIVSSCGLDSYLDYYNGDEKNWQPEKGWCQTRYIPGLTGSGAGFADIPFDFHEMIEALAPRHVFIIARRRIQTSGPTAWTGSRPRLGRSSSCTDTEERLKVEHPDCHPTIFRRRCVISRTPGSTRFCLPPATLARRQAREGKPTCGPAGLTFESWTSKGRAGPTRSRSSTACPRRPRGWCADLVWDLSRDIRRTPRSLHV